VGRNYASLLIRARNAEGRKTVCKKAVSARLNEYGKIEKKQENQRKATPCAEGKMSIYDVKENRCFCLHLKRVSKPA